MPVHEDVQYLTCTNCGEEVDSDVVRYSNSSQVPLCEYCFDEQFTTCGECDRVVDVEDSTYVSNGEAVCHRCCDQCFSICHSCEERYRSSDMCGSGDTVVCITCREDYFECCNCSELVHMDDVRERGDRTYCRACVPSPDHRINSYSYRPCPIYKGKSKLRFGVELEVAIEDYDNGYDGHSDALDIIINSLGDFVFCKHDSSTCEDGHHGFEIVTHPGDWDYFQSRKEDIDSMLSNLVKLGYRSYQTDLCGMHIHVTKSAISPLTRYKLQKFFSEFPDLVLRLSKRKRSLLARWAAVPIRSKKGSNHEVYKIKYAKGEYPLSMERYTAIRFTDYTIEFRIFRGTLNPNGFWENMECVLSLIRYLESVSMKEMTGVGYCGYVEVHAKQYPHLAKFIKRRINEKYLGRSTLYLPEFEFNSDLDDEYDDYEDHDDYYDED